MAKSIVVANGSLSQQSVRNALTAIQTAVVDQLLNTGGLAIGTGSKTKIKLVNTVYALIDGVLVKKTTAELTLTTAANVANAAFNVIVVTLNASGTLAARVGTAGATIGAVVMPAIPAGEVSLGFVIINPTGTGGFVGGTTDLDDATVVPNAVYVNTVGTFNPNALSLGGTVS